jgi:hypothetical protein
VFGFPKGRRHGSALPDAGLPPLSALGLSASSIAENSAAGTVVGGILNKTPASTLSLANDAGGRFAISGGNLVAGATSTDYETATSHSITIRETLGGSSNSPRDSIFTITVTDVFEAAPAPVNTVLPALSGNATVGQRLFTTNGTWDIVPTSVAYQWYKAGVAILNETSDNYLVDDADAAATLTCQVTAYNGTTASVPASTAASAAVAAIDLSADAPTLARVSGSGVTPVNWTIAYASKTYAGYAIEIEEADANDFSNILQDVERPILENEMDGTTNGDWSGTPLAPFGGATFVRARVKAVSPEGAHYASAWSAVMQITDGVSPVIWNDSDKSGNTVITDGLQIDVVSGFGGARSTRGSAVPFYFEALDSNHSGLMSIGVGKASMALNNWAGGNGSDGASWRSDGEVFWGGGEATDGHTFVGGNRLKVACDPVNGKVYFGKVGVGWLIGDPVAGTGGLAVAAGTFFAVFGGGFGAYEEVIAAFAAADFVDAPPPGFGAIA